MSPSPNTISTRGGALNRALGLPSQEPEWFRLPVMRRIAISTPNVMTALRRLRRDHARPYNFALSPVLVNLTGNQVNYWRRSKKILHVG